MAKNKKIIIVGVFLGITICSIVLLSISIFHLGSYKKLDAANRKTLITLGAEASSQKEIPIASILLYKNKVVGRGRNTVNGDINIAGHAEINAVNDAIKLFGFKTFEKLNPDSILLITTFEPCPMCKGALSENHIKNILVVQEKSFYYRAKEWQRYLNLNRNMKFVENDPLQDSLFKVFPDVDVKDISY